ncbi:leucine-rich repeat protein [Prevotella intermedia]|uniref:leucine-rich repeat protein n=1 Tax=Prevotella intermedia TaxID=28131 RepID=UPI0026942E7A
MRKKVFIILSVILAISTHLFAYTDGQIVKFGTNTYKVVSASAKTLCFLGCDNSVSGLLVIPATIFDNKDVTFTVTEVGGNDAYGCKNITSVKLPDTMLKINWSSFNYAKLTNMNIPKNLHTIAKGTGWAQLSSPKCTVDPANSHFVNDDEGALYSKDMTELYWVPSQVTLNNGVYTVNEKVTKIYWNAFHDIVGLKKIILPKNLAFVQKGFPTITPASNSLEEFEITGGGTTTYKVIDGVLFDEQEHQLVVYPRAKITMVYRVPDGIKSVGSYAITSANKMKAIDFNQVVKLELSALFADNGLVTIILPKDLEENENIEGCIEACLNVK